VEWLEEREEPVVPQEQEQKKIQKKIQKKSGGGSEEDAGQVQSIAKGEKLKEEMGEQGSRGDPDDLHGRIE